MNKLSIEELKDVVASAKTSFEQYLALELISIREAQGVPVAYIADCGTIISDSDPFFDDYKNPQPLFTAPQKPVVLPDGYKPSLQRGGQQSTSYRAIMTFHGDWLHRDMVIEAIKAAGGIVKESE